MPEGKAVAIIGGGWAGLAAAVEATELGHAVTLFDMAPRLGGRARDVQGDALLLDNGQHICIGAYTETLRLMRKVGVPESAAFRRIPLQLIDATGSGLELRRGPASLAFAQAVLFHRSWSLREKVGLLAASARWFVSEFRCDPALTVSRLTEGLSPAVRRDLIDPLCVSALNTHADFASAQVFLRVLHDALLSGAGSADLLLPRMGLGALLPAPAATWLRAAQAKLRLRHRVERIERDADGWSVDGLRFAHVVLAASSAEAAHLTARIVPEWAARAAALEYAPIMTIYMTSAGTVLPRPMITLSTDPANPAQFVFDRGQLGGPSGLLAFVVSGAERWVEAGRDATLEAVMHQAERCLGDLLKAPLVATMLVTEKRATFRCTPGLKRPPMKVAPCLTAAGDYVDGPYPATLEGAVRSGVAAARAITA
ncbi:MAG: hydroxysqualene dehydroxylase HpnE [Caldimonas sp.]